MGKGACWRKQMGWSWGWAGMQRTEVSDAQTAMAGANAAAPSGPNLLLFKSSCIQERGNGRDEPNKQSGREARKGA